MKRHASELTETPNLYIKIEIDIEVQIITSIQTLKMTKRSVVYAQIGESTSSL